MECKQTKLIMNDVKHFRAPRTGVDVKCSTRALQTSRCILNQHHIRPCRHARWARREGGRKRDVFANAVPARRPAKLVAQILIKVHMRVGLHAARRIFHP